MQTVSQLLEAMHAAAQANRRNEFDQLERELLSRFEGGFSGMPADVYERYLEVDRAWPVTLYPSQEEEEPGAEDDEVRAPVGPPVEFAAELPEELVSWLAELGDRCGYNRSQLLCECLQLIRTDERIAAALQKRLARRPKG